MDINLASRTFATLGHPGRLGIFRLLMRFAPQGVRPTEIAEALAMKPNTLSHHLSDLTSSGLVQVKRDGRSLFYSVDMAQAEGLVAYLALDVGRARPDLISPFLAAAHEDDLQDAGFNVLFICSGNSARSIFAEAILRDLGNGRFKAFSAGTRPNTTLNPFALDVLELNGHATGEMRSKHISEFQQVDSPAMDFVFTVCDTAAAEECPPWPGQPITGHWCLPDPVRATGTEAEKGLVFAQTYAALRRRIAAFVELPFAELNRISLQSRVDAIGTDATDLKG